MISRTNDEDNSIIIDMDQSSALDEKGIFLFWGDIHPRTSFPLIDFIFRQNLESEQDHLSIILNSSGGYVYEAAAIVDVMKSSRLPVWTYGVGQIASSACDILMSGAKGHRYLFKNTIIMTHQWSGKFEIGGNNKSLSLRKYQKIIDDICRGVIKENTGLSDEKIDADILTEFDNFMNAEEAIALGLADEIITAFPF